MHPAPFAARLLLFLPCLHQPPLPRPAFFVASLWVLLVPPQCWGLPGTRRGHRLRRFQLALEMRFWEGFRERALAWFGLQKEADLGIPGLWRASSSPGDGRLCSRCHVSDDACLLRYKIF